MRDADVYLLYILFCRDKNSRVRSYVGITNNLPRRLKQHRGELSGGAEYTTKLREQGCEWILGATGHGFRCQNEVLKVEWAVQHPGKSRHLKHRVVLDRQNAYLRNLDNLFFITHQVTRYSHISACVHSAPKATVLDVVQQRYKNFALLPERLLLERPYSAFINSYNETVGHPPTPRNGNNDLPTERPKQRPVPQKPQSSAARYREEARRLLACTRTFIDLSGN